MPEILFPQAFQCPVGAQALDELVDARLQSPVVRIRCQVPDHILLGAQVEGDFQPGVETLLHGELVGVDDRQLRLTAVHQFQ